MPCDAGPSRYQILVDIEPYLKSYTSAQGLDTALTALRQKEDELNRVTDLLCSICKKMNTSDFRENKKLYGWYMHHLGQVDLKSFQLDRQNSAQAELQRITQQKSNE